MSIPTKPRYVGAVRWADDMIPAIRRGIVLINGRKASILDRDTGDGNKPHQVDVMRDVVIDEAEAGDRVTLTGKSLYATHTIKSADTEVQVIVDLKGCKNC